MGMQDACCSLHHFTRSLCAQLCELCPEGQGECQGMQTEAPMVMDRQCLEPKLNTVAKSSQKWKISSKCVEEAIVEATSVILILL